MTKLRTVLFILTVLACANMALAQTEVGQVTGNVLDPSGARIPNATVSLRSQSMGLLRTGQTNDAGLFLFTGVLAGQYELTAEAAGFSKYSQVVTVGVGARVGVDIRLEVGTSETVIQVTETAGQVNVETQTLQRFVNRQALEEMPTLTRDPYALVATAGNVSDGTPDGRGVGYSINGMRASSTNVLLDGSANNDEFTATTGQSVPLDSVQEFSVMTSNFTAEFGRASGGVVNLITRSGTNEFHGSAYEFNRVSRLNANSFDNNANELPKSTFARNQFGYSIGGPAKKDKLFFFNNIEWFRVRSAARRTVWIPTDALINASAQNTKDFFAAYGTVRSSLVDLGTFSKDQLKASGFDPCTGGAADGGCALLPGSTPMFRRLSYSYPADSGGGDPRNEYQLVGRVDYNLSSHTQIYGRLAIQNQNIFAGAVADSPYQGFDTPQTTKNQNYLVSLIHTFSPTVTMQSKAVFNRLNQTQPLGDQPATPTLYAFGTSAASILGSRLGFPGYLPFNPGSAIPFGGPQNFVQLYQDMSYSRSRHQFRFGGSYTYFRDNRTFGAYMNSVVQLAGAGKFGLAVDNLLAGQALSYQGAVDPQGKYPCGATVDASCTVTLPVGQPSFSRSNRYHEFAYYVQDSWKATRSVTLSLGLRWEYFGVQHNKNPKLDSNLYFGSGSTYEEQFRNATVMLAPDSPVGGLWGKDFNNYSPRLGVAWDVFGNGKTSLRGGWGLAYERNFGNVTFNVIQNPPNYAVISIVAPQDVPRIPITTAVTGPLSGTSGSKPLPVVSLRAVDPNIRTAYAHTYSAAVEHAVTSNLTASVEFSGSKGVKLYSMENRNSMGAGNYYLGDTCSAADFDCTNRLLPYRYSNINLREQGGISDYAGLNTRLEVRRIASIGLSGASVSYTWSHALDNLSDTFSSSGNQYNLGLLDPVHPELEKGSAYFDQRHRITLSGTWELPIARSSKGAVGQVLGGWSLSPIFTAHTGFPYTMYDCTNAIGYPSGAGCPMGMFYNKVGNVTGDSKGPSAGVPNQIQYFDIAALAPYHDWTNPKVGFSDYGPFPAYMTGRNTFRAPGTWSMDMAIHKTFSIKERYRLQFRFEAYNTFNHANLYADTSWGETNYDFIPAYREDNRNIQLGLRFDF